MGNYVDYLHVSCHLVRFRARLTRVRLPTSPVFGIIAVCRKTVLGAKWATGFASGIAAGDGAAADHSYASSRLSIQNVAPSKARGLHSSRRCSRGAQKPASRERNYPVCFSGLELVRQLRRSPSRSWCGSGGERRRCRNGVRRAVRAPGGHCRGGTVCRLPPRSG